MRGSTVHEVEGRAVEALPFYVRWRAGGGRGFGALGGVVCCLRHGGVSHEVVWVAPRGTGPLNDGPFPFPASQGQAPEPREM